jgi:hypothetical protein
MARTDAHRPSAINPEDYDFVACDYYDPWAAQMFMHERKFFRDHMERTVGKFATKHNSGTCHVCGAAAMYVAKYHHRPSNSYIVTGMDCAEKMDFGGTGSFKAFKAKVSHERKIMKGKAVAHEVLALLGMSDAYRVYEAGSYQEGKWLREESIICEMVMNLVKYGKWSEKQAEFCRKLLGDIASRPQREAERAAQKEAEAAASNYVGNVGDRLSFDLVVQFVSSFETQFGIMHVHVMKDDAGNVIVYKGNRIAAKDEKVSLKATVKDHKEYKGVKQTVICRPKIVEA